MIFRDNYDNLTDLDHAAHLVPTLQPTRLHGPDLRHAVLQRAALRDVAHVQPAARQRQTQVQVGSERMKDRALIRLTNLFANMHQDIVHKFCDCLDSSPIIYLQGYSMALRLLFVNRIL